MERLTKKVNPVRFDENCISEYAFIKNHNEIHNAVEISNKLGKYEDLEEQIGCPLEVIIKKELQGGFYVEEEPEEGLVEMVKYNPKTIQYNEWTQLHYWEGACSYPNLKDYKKTWWLKADKSE